MGWTKYSKPRTLNPRHQTLNPQPSTLTTVTSYTLISTPLATRWALEYVPGLSQLGWVTGMAKANKDAGK
jgi:hypothetical protein